MMKRGHTRADYIEKIRKLRQIRPNISLSSDFIIGFPGETDNEFEETLAFIDEIGFDCRSVLFIAKDPAHQQRICLMMYLLKSKNCVWNAFKTGLTK